MPTPQLVVADAASKKYPGGVIAIRCSDWMAGARGSLSSESDPLASSGFAVRDTQHVAKIGPTTYGGDFTTASDTLAITLADVGLETDMAYDIFLSVLFEGDWDSTNQDTYRGSNQDAFLYTGDVAIYGVGTFSTAAASRTLRNKPRMRDHYTLQWCGWSGYLTGSETLSFRAFGLNGTTIEVLLDQVILVPRVVSGNHGAGSVWRASDFQISIEGDSATFQDQTLVDGADGGTDSNGKFTYDPFVDVTDPGMLSGSAGDYQKYATGSSAEYLERVVTDDFFELHDSTVAGPNNEPAGAYAYSIHGANYRQAETLVSDTFTRTISHSDPDSWGRSEPKAFGWRTFNGGVFATSTDGAETDGSVGIHKLRYDGGTEQSNDPISQLSNFANFGFSSLASCTPRSLDFTGRVQVSSALPGTGYMSIAASPVQSTTLPGVEFVLQASSGVWNLYLTGTGQTQSLASGTAGFFGSGVWVRWRIQTRRYRWRFRLWEDGTTEPSTWDYDDYIPIDNGAGTPIAYPYAAGNVAPGSVGSDKRDIGPYFLAVATIGNGTIPSSDDFDTAWDDITVAVDPYGSAEPITARLEKPEGTLLGEIEVPVGAYHMVYWGQQDYTDLVVGDAPYVVFSHRVYNDTGAAELQRADTNQWWLRRVFPPTIVSMNWRSADSRAAGGPIFAKGIIQ